MAAILGASCNGLSFARSLSRHGIPTLLVDGERLLGTATRFGEVALLPPVERFPEQWIAFLEAVGARLRVPGILFTTSDASCLLVSRQRDALQQHFRFLLPDAQSLERIVNKRWQYEAAAAAGVRIPRSAFPASVEEAEQKAAALGYPCLLKPYVSHVGRAALDGRKVVVAATQGELVAAYRGITNQGVDLMIQEIIPGGDDALFGYLAFWDAGGRERAWLTKRKLRQYPPGFGDGSLQVTVDAPQVVEQSRALLQAFAYRGFVGVEFKFDARDRSYRLMEINPRTVSGNQLAIDAGVDFPWLGYRALCGAATADDAAPTFARQVRYVNEEWDLQAYLALRAAGRITLRQWLASLRGVRSHAIWARDDPGPMLEGIGRLVARWGHGRLAAIRARVALGAVRSGRRPDQS